MKTGHILGRVLCLAAALTLLVAWKPDDGPVITAGHEAYFAANVDEARAASCGWSFHGTRIQPREVFYRFTHKRGARATVKLGHPGRCAGAREDRFCVSATMAGGARPGDRCGTLFLRTMVSDGVRKNPGRFSWFVARAEKYRPFETRARPPGKPLTLKEKQFWLVGGLLSVLLVALVFCLVRARPWRTLSRPEGAGLAACLTLAVAARLALDPFPADVWLSTSQGLWITGVHHWSAAYSVLLHLLYWVLPTTLNTAAAANVVLSCATVLAVYIFAALYFDDRRVALASAAVLALQPISIRYAASDSPHVLTTLTLFLAVLFTTLWIRRGGYLLALQAAGWLAVCANTRIEAAVCAGAVICVAGGLYSRRSPATWRQLLVAALPCLAVMAFPVWDALTTVLERPAIGAFSLLGILKDPFLRSPHSPVVVIGLAALGGGVVLAPGKLRRPGLLWILAIVPMAMPSIYITDAGWEHTHRHSLPTLAMFALVAGVGLGWLLGPGLSRVTREPLGDRARAWLAPALALLIAALAAAPNLSILTKTWSHELEFRFLRGNLGRVKDGCTVVGIKQPDAHVGLNLFPVLSHEVGRQHHWREPAELLAMDGRPPACTVFIESASCHASHARPPSAGDGMFKLCAAIMDGYVLQPVATTTIPAQPYIGEVFTRDPIPLGIHRVLGRKPRARSGRRQVRGRRTASD